MVPLLKRFALSGSVCVISFGAFIVALLQSIPNMLLIVSSLVVYIGCIVWVSHD